MPRSLSHLRLLVLARDAAGYLYMMVIRTLWFGAGWMLIIWRFQTGFGIAGRAIVRVTTGRVRLIRNSASALRPARDLRQ